MLYGIWGFYEMGRLSKIISPMLNICEMENYLIRYKRQTKNAYMISFLLILPSFFVWSVLDPSTWILPVMKEMDIPVVISSDSHKAEELTLCFNEAEEALRTAGYKETVCFRSGEFRYVSL